MNKICLLLFGLLSPLVSFASHAMGGEISYVYLGNHQYCVTYTFYRDCSGIAAPATASLDVTSATGTQTFTMNPTVNSPIRLHTVCPTELTTCNGGFNLGVEQWIYTDTITLGSDDITMSHSENARSASLNTISGSGGNLFVYATLKNSNVVSNNSPVFNAIPTLVLCQNNQYCIPSFVSDPDGDSLSFSLITPRTGPTPADTLSYLTGYSATRPFASNPPVTIDAATGELCIDPTAAGEVSPMAILVSEYRNGVLIGEVERDMQISIITCVNSFPALTGLNGVPLNTLNVCAGQQNCFFITGTDQDVANALFVNWDISLPGATTIHTFGNRDTLFICWTPSDSDTLSNPHCFTAMATDDNCPYPATAYDSYCLNVIPSQVCNPNGINEDSYPDNSFIVFPQPARNEVNFSFEKLTPGRILTIYSFVGTVIQKIPVTDKLMRWDTGEVPAGLYDASVTDESGINYFSKQFSIIK